MERSRWLVRAAVFFCVLLLRLEAASAYPFTFTLSSESKTSAGVFASDGTLVKTLWSGVDYVAGTYSSAWDETDDGGHGVADGSYQVRVLTSQATYTWEGVVGNTSTSYTTDTYHYMQTIDDVAIAGTKAYLAAGYNEQNSGQAYFPTTDPGSTTRILGPGGEFFKVATDGTNVYWGGDDPADPSKGFVMATAVADDTQVAFSHGAPYTCVYGMTYTSTIDLEAGAGAPTGLAVQTSGQYLFVSRAGIDSLNVIDKSTGQVIQALVYTAPGDLAVDPDDAHLWMIHTVSGAPVVERFAINSDGTLTDGASITGLTKPLAVGSNGTDVMVIDGGASQQIKAFDFSGSSAWTLGQAGGYTSDPNVTDDKFDFEPGVSGSTVYLTPTTDGSGSFWVGDPGDFRNQHYSSARALVERIAYVPTNYSIAADPNDPTRVFASYLEYQINYDLPLGPNNGSWSLARNWRPGVPDGYDDPYIRMAYVTTLSNGRTYATLAKSLFELPSSGLLRNASVTLESPTGDPAGLFPDGSIRWSTVSGSVETWYQKSLTGFDGSNNPQYGSPTAIGSAPVGVGQANDVDTNWNQMRPGNETTGGVIVAFQQDADYGGYHLGGVALGGGSPAWKWQASRSLPAPFDAAAFPLDGSYGLGGSANAGGAVMTTDHHVFYGYRGGADFSLFYHYYDDGLLAGIFGALPGQPEGAAGVAGNDANQWLVKLGDGRVYLYTADESAHGGVHRWKIGNLDTVTEQTVSVDLHKDVWPGLTAEYFDTPDWNDLTLVTTRLDSQVDFDWGSTTPPGTGLTDNQTFSVRWSGFVVPTTTETYTFTIDADDSAKVWVGGQLVATSAAPGTLAVTAGTSYPIRVEYKQGTGTASASLEWSSASIDEEVIPTAQLYTVPPGAYLMAGLPSSGSLVDGTAGWNRSPATDDGDYWTPWHVTMQSNGGNPYLHVDFANNDAAVNASVTRDLGAASSDTASWQVSMNVSFDSTYANHDPGCGQRLELLDDAGKALAQFYLNMFSYPDDGRIIANGKTLAQDAVWPLTVAMYPWLPLSISASDGQITFQYGPYPAVTAAEADPTADWRRLKTFRLYFYTATSGVGYPSDVDVDGLRVTRTAAGAGTDLLAGIPAASAPVAGDDPWLDDGDYGWSATGTYDSEYWENWTVKTNDKLDDPAGPLDIGADFVTITPGKTASLSRSLGVPTDDTASWALAGQVKYENNYPGSSAANQSLDVVDDAGKVIARMEGVAVSVPSDGRLEGNGTTVIGTDVPTLQWDIMYYWQPFAISAANGLVTFQYGTSGPVTTAVFDPTADWRRPAALRNSFWNTIGPGGNYFRSVDFTGLTFQTDKTTDGLVLWLKADALTGSDGDAVSTWADASGRGNDAKQSASSSQPILKTGSNGLNGLNVVRFDGSDDFLRTAFDPGPSGMTVFYVARSSSSSPNWQILLSSGGASGTSGVRWGFGLNGNPYYTIGAGWAGTDSSIGLGNVSGFATNKAFFARYRTDGSTWTVDGVNSTTASDTSFPKGLFAATIGAESPGAWQFAGDIAELRVYNRALTDDECASIKSDMKTKWGVP